jgi:hypothetical protein
MPDSETLTMRRTVIGGIRYSDDYQVINGEIIFLKKATRRRLLNSSLMIVDQAAINAGCDFRRYHRKHRRVERAGLREQFRPGLREHQIRT